MATHFRENMSIDALAETLDALCAALHADPETASVVATWTALSGKADELAQQSQQFVRAQRRARARLGVCDNLWDTVEAAFGRAVVDASGGRRDQSPYTRFFAKAAPSAVQTFGIQREIDTARDWLIELGRNSAEPLATTWIPQLTQATDNLDDACKARNQAVRALGPHQTTVTLFVDDVNCELDRLEGQLKLLFPGDAQRVASYLAVTRPQRAAVPDDPQPPAPQPPAPTN
jgi:hypothetical protein